MGIVKIYFWVPELIGVLRELLSCYWLSFQLQMSKITHYWVTTFTLATNFRVEVTSEEMKSNTLNLLT